MKYYLRIFLLFRIESVNFNVIRIISQSKNYFELQIYQR